MSAPTPFARLGYALSAARADAGLDTQADLAKAIGVKQQTVSRWEAGTHRPRPAQLASLGVVLKLSSADLLQMAGYDALPAESYVAQFPIDRLSSSDIFEQFISFIAAELYRGAAEVRRVGKTGHKQSGVDVIANFKDGRRAGFQCKHVARFGPADVKAAVAAYPEANDMKFLALSRVASPQTAEEVRKHPGWTLWDKDDISRIIRQELSSDSQDRIVSSFFRGQGLLLLGRSEPGPWLTAADFFGPFNANEEAVLSHRWQLVGRTEETATLLGALVQGGKPALLMAPGGMGKSRLLAAIADHLSEVEPGSLLRFFARDGELTPTSLSALGSGPKILVVDDAHDRDGLSLLFQYVAQRENQARLLLASRPYAGDRIRNEAAIFGMTELPIIELKRLDRARLLELATAVLDFYKGDPNAAEAVVAHAGDSPLATVMASRIIARDGSSLELARSEQGLRELILGKFAKVIVGEIGRKGDEDLHQNLLDVLALSQPFHPSDPHLLGFIEKAKGISPDASARGLRTLAEGGVIFKRGHQHRLMPDLLGDFIIERCCLDVEGNLSPFARRVLDAVPEALLSNVLVNLSRMDWRRSEGDPAKSRLLAAVWGSLDTIEEHWDPRLAAAKGAAIYQPNQALDLVRRLYQRGRRFDEMSEILETVALTKPDLFVDACDLLWALGRNDTRELGRHPNHPIRTLAELGEYKSRKPVEYSERLLDFALAKMAEPRNWEGAYTPLRLIEPMMKGEGEDRFSDHRTMSFRPFFVQYEVVRPLRERILDKVLSLLRDGRIVVAQAAAAFIGSCLRSPHGTFGLAADEDIRVKYEGEFETTLTRLRQAIDQGVAPTVFMTIAREVSWHAHYGRPPCSDLAQAILDARPTDLDFRLSAAIAGFLRTLMEKQDVEQWDRTLQTRLDDLASDLCRAYPDPRARREKVDRLATSLIEAGSAPHSLRPLLVILVRQDYEFATAILEDAVVRVSQTSLHADIALYQFMTVDRAKGRAWTRRMLEAGEAMLDRSVASAYGGIEIEEQELSVISQLLRGPDTVVDAALHAMMLWRGLEPRRLIELVKAVRLDENARLADTLSMLMGIDGRAMTNQLTRDDAIAILGLFEPLPSLDGYWLDELISDLSFSFPKETAQFFMARVERATTLESYSFRAANYGPYGHKALRFLETEDGKMVFRQVWGWLLKNRDRGHTFRYAARNMFEAMFLRSHDVVVQALSSEVKTATPQALSLITELLRSAHHSFVFSQSDFVINVLERCADLDPDLLRRGTADFFSSAISGLRSGVAGEPMPQDLARLDKATQVLGRLSFASAAYQLYESIRQYSEHEIASSRAEAEAFED